MYKPFRLDESSGLVQSNPATPMIHQPHNPELLDYIRMRTRTLISPEKTAVLERAFVSLPFLTKEARMHLAKITDLPEKVIVVWFQNKRQRLRKECSVNEHSQPNESIHSQF